MCNVIWGSRKGHLGFKIGAYQLKRMLAGNHPCAATQNKNKALLPNGLPRDAIINLEPMEAIHSLKGGIFDSRPRSEARFRHTHPILG